MKEKEDFKDRLRQAMARNNMKAVELCERTGVPKSAVSYYLAGKSTPKADRLYIIAETLDVSEAWLLGYEVPMERTQAQKRNDSIARLVAEMKRNPNLLGTFEVLADSDRADDEEFAAVIKAIAGLSPEKFAGVKALLIEPGQK